MSVALQRRLLTITDYHRMVEAGILTESDRVELIRGEIIEMSPINSLHASYVKRVSRACHRLLGQDYIIGVQDPIQLGTDSEPEPDICICLFRDDYYLEQHPRPEEIILLIEVADSTLEKDRQVKAPLYAGAGIPEYWIFNLQDGCVEVYRDPQDGTYQEMMSLQETDQIRLPGTAKAVLDLADFF